MREKIWIITAGILVGVFAVILVILGNPANMGFCIACFLRDLAGGLGLHRAGAVQYLRPEIIGLVLGAFMVAFFSREFKATGGSSPVLRFVLGMLMMAGALIFLGCPLRMILRLAGGDWNALVALPGYIAGIWAGTVFLKKGYSLGRVQDQPAVNGYAAPVLALSLLILVIAAPAFIFFSAEGPGSLRAPLGFALGAGLLVGALAFGIVLAYGKIPQNLTEWVTGLPLSPIMILVVINVFLLILGSILETGAIMMVVWPILIPVAKALGFDQIGRASCRERV